MKYILYNYELHLFMVYLLVVQSAEIYLIQLRITSFYGLSIYLLFNQLSSSPMEVSGNACMHIMRQTIHLYNQEIQDTEEKYNLLE